MTKLENDTNSYVDNDNGQCYNARVATEKPMPTIADFAALTKTQTVISRAISFDPRLFTVWSQPCDFSNQLKTSYGRGGSYGIKLHPAIQGYPDQFRNTFLHEVAHVCEWILYRKCGHGANWWEAMIRLGEKPWEKNNHDFSLRRHNQIAAEKELEGLNLL